VQAQGFEPPVFAAGAAFCTGACTTGAGRGAGAAAGAGVVGAGVVVVVVGSGAVVTGALVTGAGWVWSLAGAGVALLAAASPTDTADAATRAAAPPPTDTRAIRDRVLSRLGAARAGRGGWGSGVVLMQVTLAPDTERLLKTSSELPKGLLRTRSLAEVGGKQCATTGRVIGPHASA